MLTVEKLPRQAKYNAGIKHFVVKLDGAEIGVIEKIPRQPYEGRLMGAINALGQYDDTTAAALAIYKAHKTLN